MELSKTIMKFISKPIIPKAKAHRIKIPHELHTNNPFNKNPTIHKTTVLLTDFKITG